MLQHKTMLDLRYTAYIQNKFNQHTQESNTSMLQSAKTNQSRICYSVNSIRRKNALETSNAQINLGRAASQSPCRVAKSPLVTMGRNKFTPKTAPFPFDDYDPHLTHPYLDRPHSPFQRHPDPLSRFSTIYCADRQTDRYTDRPTDMFRLT